MADLNEPKKETVRITLPPRTTHGPTVPVEKEAARINLPNRPPGPPAGAKPPPPNLPPPSPAPVRPPPALVAPKPTLARPPAPAPSGAVRPPLPPATPTAKTPLPPPPAAKAPVSPPPAAKAPVPSPPPSGVKASPPTPVGPAPPKPVFPPINPPIENRGIAQTGPRQETARIADSPMKATVKLSSLHPASVPSAPVIRTAPPVVANLPPQSLVETVSTQLCWALLGISALILLIQLWTYFA